MTLREVISSHIKAMIQVRQFDVRRTDEHILLDGLRKFRKVDEGFDQTRISQDMPGSLRMNARLPLGGRLAKMQSSMYVQIVG